MSKELNGAYEDLYLIALEYLVNKAYHELYIKQLADYYQTKGLSDLAEKYYKMDELYQKT